MLTTIYLLLVFYRSITMLYNNFSDLWVVYNKFSINHENCIQICIVLKKRRKLTQRAYTMWNIDEKPLLTIQELDQNIKRFACSSMFVIRQFFVCEMIRRYIYITKSTAIKYYYCIVSTSIYYVEFVVYNFIRDTYLKISSESEWFIIKKNRQTTFGNDFNLVERVHVHIIVYLYIVETSLERFIFSHCQYYFISIKYRVVYYIFLYTYKCINGLNCISTECGLRCMIITIIEIRVRNKEFQEIC